MEHKTLTAKITSKGKKHLENFEPAFFSEIPYQNVTEINYLKDLQEKKQSLDFPIFQFQKDFGQQAPTNDFDRLANTLYKKIMQQGYIQQKKAPSKKKKKTKNPLEYDYEDEWINDEEAITVKKNIYVKVENFKCFSQGIEDFYNSDLYKSSLSQIQQQTKKKTNEIAMDPIELEEIKQKIKENISNAHNKAKEELDAEKQNIISDNRGHYSNLEANSNNDELKNQNSKVQDCQSVKSISGDVSGNDSAPKLSQKSSKSQKSGERPNKRDAKAPSKTKTVKKPIKSDKKPKEKHLAQEIREQIPDDKKTEQNAQKLHIGREVHELLSEKEENIETATKNFENLNICEAKAENGRIQKMEEEKEE